MEENKVPVQIKETDLKPNFTNLVRVTPIGNEVILDFGIESPASFTLNEEQVNGIRVDLTQRLVMSNVTAAKLVESLQKHLTPKEEQSSTN